MAPEIFADKSQALKKGRMVKKRLLFGKISFFLGGERVVLDVGSWEGNNTKSIQIFHNIRIKEKSSIMILLIKS